jgi:secreted trypsin-like serine protease
MRRSAVAVFIVFLSPVSAYALVGGAAEVRAPEMQPVVMLVGSHGNFCTGSLIAPDLILTAAHCVQPGADYKIFEMGADRQPMFTDIVSIARHPRFNLKTMLAHRATADVALLKLPKKLSARPALLLPTRGRVAVGERFIVRGYGVAVQGDGNSAGRLREAILSATNEPGNLQLRLVDPKSSGTRPGLGACTGDSGAPVYQETPSGLAIYGVASWSTGPNGEGGCGGLTGVTPLELYRPWIDEQVKRMSNASASQRP